jgi:hypothetical protein
MNNTLNASLEILFNYICFSCYYYYPNKANKKKIKELFNALPFFLPMQYQNTLYKLIKKYPIETYYDKKETMMDYGYIIYREFNITINKKYLDYNEYIDHFYLALYKDNRVYKKWVNHFIFIFISLLIIYYIYTIR